MDIEEKDKTEESELVDIWDVELDSDDVDELDQHEENNEEDEEENIEEENIEEDDESDLETTDDHQDEEEDVNLEDIPLVNSIQQILGYEFDEEFEDTDEGIAKMFEEASNKKADEALNTLLEKYPEAKDLIEYRELGGN